MRAQRARWTVFGCMVFAASCTLTTDLPEGSGAASTTTSATAGNGGASSSSQGTSAGGGPLAICDLFDAASCPLGTKCTVVDAELGMIGCDDAGAVPLWDACADDAECAAGGYCEVLAGVCVPFCQDAGDCDDGATCIAARLTSMTEIPGVKVCTSNCDPLTGDPCVVQSALTCAPNPNGDFTCNASRGHVPGDTCIAHVECEARYACAGSPSRCLAWCTPVGFNANCICNPFFPDKIFHNGQEYGYCI